MAPQVPFWSPHRISSSVRILAPDMVVWSREKKIAPDSLPKRPRLGNGAGRYFNIFSVGESELIAEKGKINILLTIWKSPLIFTGYIKKKVFVFLFTFNIRYIFYVTLLSRYVLKSDHLIKFKPVGSFFRG